MIVSIASIAVILPFLYFKEIINPLWRVIKQDNRTSFLVSEEISTLKSIIEKRNSQIPKSPEEINDNLKNKIQKVIQYIENNYHHELSRDGLAAMINLDPDYMSKLFKAYSGVKINDFINKLRIEEACKLLINSDKSIIEICLAVGFENLRTFNRVFLKNTGQTPSQYRNTNKHGRQNQ